MTIQFGPDLTALAVVPLAALRCLGVFAVAPLFGSRFVPAQVRVALGLCCGMLLVPLATARFGGAGVPDTVNPWLGLAAAPAGYVLRCAGEVVFGLGIGYLGLLFLSALQVAGQIMDTEIGFSMVNVLDPQFGVQLPLLGSLFNVLGILVFLSLDGHLMLLRAVTDSVRLIPLGGVGMPPGVGDLLIRAFAGTFVTALKIAAPVLAALLLTNVALGIVARTVPQMNVFVVGLPLRVAVGLGVLVVSLPFAATVVGPALFRCFDFIDRLIAAVAG